MIPICSVVTKKTLAEFKLLKFSIEQFHDIHWFVSCDEEVEKYYRDTPKIDPVKVIETDDCDHNIQSEEKNNNWMKVMMSKFVICREALSKYDYCLFLDSDIMIRCLKDYQQSLNQTALWSGLILLERITIKLNTILS